MASVPLSAPEIPFPKQDGPHIFAYKSYHLVYNIILMRLWQGKCCGLLCRCRLLYAVPLQPHFVRFMVWNPKCFQISFLRSFDVMTVLLGWLCLLVFLHLCSNSPCFHFKLMLSFSDLYMSFWLKLWSWPWTLKCWVTTHNLLQNQQVGLTSRSDMLSNAWNLGWGWKHFMQIADGKSVTGFRSFWSWNDGKWYSALMGWSIA